MRNQTKTHRTACAVPLKTVPTAEQNANIDDLFLDWREQFDAGRVSGNAAHEFKAVLLVLRHLVRFAEAAFGFRGHCSKA